MTRVRLEPSVSSQALRLPRWWNPSTCMWQFWGPQGFWGSGENGFLFSGSWGALVIILGELGSNLIIWGIQRALPKSKKIKKSLHFVWFFKKFFCSDPLDNYICIYFPNNMQRNMAINFLGWFFSFQLLICILWDAPRLHHFLSKIFLGEHAPGSPPTNSVTTQCSGVTYTPAIYYHFR